MVSFNYKYFIHKLFQNLYNDLSLEGFCGLKGSFVIGDYNNFFFNCLIKLNSINKFPLVRSNTGNLGSISSSSVNSLKDRSKKGVGEILKSTFGKLIEIPFGFRSHLKFFNYTSPALNKLYEIDLLDKPLIFICESITGNFCYKVVCKNIKFYKFIVNSRQYLYLKFETSPTFSIQHIDKAYHTYLVPTPRSSDLSDCLGGNNSDSKYLFYHAENKDINYNEQKIAAKIVGLDFKEYMQEKKMYSGCLTNKICNLGNEIYIPESYVNNFYKENFEISNIQKLKLKTRNRTNMKSKEKNKNITKTRSKSNLKRVSKEENLIIQKNWLESELERIENSINRKNLDYIAGRRKIKKK